MLEPDRIEHYLQRLTPSARSNLLTELERLEVCGTAMPGSEALLEKLRAEFRKGETDKSGHTNVRVAHPSRYFFMPLEPLLVNGDPEMPIPAGYCVARWHQSGNGSPGICCRQWRATTSAR
jgi:hypothetical protein